MMEWWSKQRSSSHHKHAAVSTKEDGGDDDEHLWRVMQASDSKKERKAKLHHSYERNECIVKLEARHIMLRDHPDEDDYEGEEEDLAQGVVVIPRPEQRRPHSSPLSRSKQNHLDEEDQEKATTTTTPETTCSTHVPNCCIICLEHYRPGDTIVWSHHVDCPHAFHRKCVTKYLVKMMQRRRNNASTPCPVCRRPFTDLEVEPRTKRRRRRQRTASERRRRSEEASASASASASSRVCEWWTRVVSFFCR